MVGDDHSPLKKKKQAMYIEIDVFSLFLLGDGFKYVKKFTPTCEDDPI